MSQQLDVAGIGAGPFNLSVAALLAPLDHIRSAFFDKREHFDWHPGMMLAGAKLQTSFLKDLVTAADPTSAYSFLAYLVAHRRFYRFINAEFSHVERREFADYLKWVAEKLPNLRLNHEVQEVGFSDGHFRLRFAQGEAQARHLVVATGTTPRIPEWARAHHHPRCLHTHRYLAKVPDVRGLRVAVIGGGQSGAEVVLDLLSGQRGEAASISWLSRRQTLEALEETPFSNEFFTPSYVDAFHRLPMARKPAIVERQKLAGDGISPETLKQLYQTLYTDGFLTGTAQKLRILPHREVQAMDTHAAGGWSLAAHNGFDGRTDRIDADVVILATGYLTKLPGCLEPLHDRLDLDPEGRFLLQRDFSVGWDGPTQHRIYVQNGGRYSHGIADPQLSLAAWRGATIVNSLLGEARYATGDAPLPIEWATHTAKDVALEKAA
ncbi:lysine N(6)-hydroxylase/L-ornithine N(5)-oxygenase family protein [Chitinimonas naiadis]